jgi:photosystem II stability/assembly factor-like uncharacterized protein
MLNPDSSLFVKLKPCYRHLCALLALVAVLLLGVNPAWTKSDLLLLSAVKSPRAVKSMLLDVTRAGERLVVVGERGHILLSDDNGITWKQADVPVSVTLTAAYFPSSQNGWVVGHDGVVLHSQDGGETWSVQFDGNRANKLLFEHYKKAVTAKEAELASVPDWDKQRISMELEDLNYAFDDASYALEEGGWKPFLDVWFKDDKVGFIIGAYGLIFHTVDSGVSWQPWNGHITNPDGYHYNGITGSGNMVYIAGESGTLYRSMDGGESWENLESPYRGSFFDIVSSKRTQQIVAMGLRGNVFRSNNLGTDWQKVASPVQNAISGGTLLSDDRLYVATSTILTAAVDEQKLVATKVRASGYSAVSETADGELVVVGLRGVKRIEGSDLEGKEK